jgi:hypothetical protein
MYPSKTEMEEDKNISIDIFKNSHNRITSYSVSYTVGFLCSQDTQKSCSFHLHPNLTFYIQIYPS